MDDDGNPLVDDDGNPIQTAHLGGICRSSLLPVNCDNTICSEIAIDKCNAAQQLFDFGIECCQVKSSEETEEENVEHSTQLCVSKDPIFKVQETLQLKEEEETSFTFEMHQNVQAEITIEFRLSCNNDGDTVLPANCDGLDDDTLVEYCEYEGSFRWNRADPNGQSSLPPKVVAWIKIPSSASTSNEDTMKLRYYDGGNKIDGTILYGRRIEHPTDVEHPTDEGNSFAQWNIPVTSQLVDNTVSSEDQIKERNRVLNCKLYSLVKRVNASTPSNIFAAGMIGERSVAVDNLNVFESDIHFVEDDEAGIYLAAQDPLNTTTYIRDRDTYSGFKLLSFLGPARVREGESFSWGVLLSSEPTGSITLKIELGAVSNAFKHGNVLMSLVSDPVKIECPNQACCGTDEDKNELCPNSVEGNFPIAEVESYYVGGFKFEACPLSKACLGNNICARGYTGMLCHSEKTLEIEMAKIAMSGTQALTVLGRYPLKWPRAILDMFNVANGLFSGAGDAISFTCAMKDADGSRYFRGSAVILAAPLVVISGAGTFWAMKSATYPKANRKNIRSNFIVSVMVIIFMVLPTLNQTAFQLLTCRSVGNESRVAGDFELPCFGAAHMAYIFGVAMPALLLYSIGMPMAAVSLLRRLHRLNKLFKPRQLSYASNVYAFLYGGFRRERYYWEVVIMLRKVLLNLILVVMASASPLAQSLVVQIVIFTFITAHVRCEPYSNSILNRIESLSLMLSATVLLLGLFLFDETMSEWFQMVITVVMVALILISLVALIGALFIRVKNSRAKSIKKGLLRARVKANDTLEHGFEFAMQRIRAPSQIHRS
eukprot:g1099.t1